MIPSDGVGSTPDNGRIRIDSNPVMAIRFIYTGPTNIVGIADPRTNSFGTPAYESMLNELLTAQNKILIDATNIGGGILEFKPNVRENVQPDLSEEELEEASPDAVQRIEQLVRYK